MINNYEPNVVKKICKKTQPEKKYHILTKDEKKKILLMLSEDNSLEQYQRIAELYDTSIKNLRRWLSDGIDRKPGCGRKKLNKIAEQQLQEWIISESLQQKKRVRRTKLKEKAIELFNIENFKASKAWQDEFIRNHDIKFKVNEVLYQHGLLNALQQTKFEEQKRKRKLQQEQQGLQGQIPQQNQQNDQNDGSDISDSESNENEPQQQQQQQQQQYDEAEEIYQEPGSFNSQYLDYSYRQGYQGQYKQDKNYDKVNQSSVSHYLNLSQNSEQKNNSFFQVDKQELSFTKRFYLFRSNYGDNNQENNKSRQSKHQDSDLQQSGLRLPQIKQSLADSLCESSFHIYQKSMASSQVQQSYTQQEKQMQQSTDNNNLILQGIFDDEQIQENQQQEQNQEQFEKQDIDVIIQLKEQKVSKDRKSMKKQQKLNNKKIEPDSDQELLQQQQMKKRLEEQIKKEIEQQLLKDQNDIQINLQDDLQIDLQQIGEDNNQPKWQNYSTLQELIQQDQLYQDEINKQQQLDINQFNEQEDKQLYSSEQRNCNKIIENNENNQNQNNNQQKKSLKKPSKDNQNQIDQNIANVNPTNQKKQKKQSDKQQDKQQDKQPKQRNRKEKVDKGEKVEKVKKTEKVEKIKKEPTEKKKQVKQKDQVQPKKQNETKKQNENKKQKEQKIKKSVQQQQQQEMPKQLTKKAFNQIQFAEEQFKFNKDDEAKTNIQNRYTDNSEDSNEEISQNSLFDTLTKKRTKSVNNIDILQDEEDSKSQNGQKFNNFDEKFVTDSRCSNYQSLLGVFSPKLEFFEDLHFSRSFSDNGEFNNFTFY